jgi:hypothetical protein
MKLCNNKLFAFFMTKCLYLGAKNQNKEKHFLEKLNLKINLLIMNQIFKQKQLQFIFFILFLFISFSVFSQKTFTVVCDKTDNTVKVVDSERRSPNFVPIKGGFPFRQVAQKWIDENYTTTDCDPGEILDQIQTQAKPNNSDTQNTKVTSPSGQQTNSTQNKTNSGQSHQFPVKFNNTSLLLDVKFSNLGEVLLLENNFVPGVELGFEQLIGKQIYFGTGLLFNAYFAIPDLNEEDLQFIYFGRIPAFVGYRLKNNGMVVMGEAGVHLNTKMVSTEPDKRIMGRTGTDNSVNLLGRIKLGSEIVLFELGGEFWLTDVFENYKDFNMTSVYLGLRFYF